LGDGSHISAFLRDIHHGKRADLQAPFWATSTAVEKPIQPISLLAALGDE
jgi:hypothetical protein